jgi:hypothetical protein
MRGRRAGYPYYEAPEEGYFQGGGEDNLLESLDRLDEIKQRLGMSENGGGGWGSFLKSPQAMEVIGGLLGNLFGGRKGPANGSNGQNVVVDVDGQLVEMTPQAYQIFQRQRKQLREAQTRVAALPASTSAPTNVIRKPPTAGPQPSADTGESITVISSGGPQPEKHSAPAAEKPEDNGEPEDISIDIGPYAQEICEAIDTLQPEDWAVALSVSTDEGNIDAGIFMTFLASKSYDDIIWLLEKKGYDNNPALQDYIQKFRDNREWCERVIAKIREIMGMPGGTENAGEADSTAG